MAAAPRKPAGGVRAVRLHAAADIVRLDWSGGRCTGIVLRPGARAVDLPLLECRSRYTEEVAAGEGPAAVHHTLTLVLSRWQGRGLFTFEYLQRMAADGVVALITAEDGERMVAGWTERSADEQPLQLERLTFDTGCRPTDAPTAEMVLACDDATPAAEYVPKSE